MPLERRDTFRLHSLLRAPVLRLSMESNVALIGKVELRPPMILTLRQAITQCTVIHALELKRLLSMSFPIRQTYTLPTLLYTICIWSNGHRRRYLRGIERNSLPLQQFSTSTSTECSLAPWIRFLLQVVLYWTAQSFLGSISSVNKLLRV